VVGVQDGSSAIEAVEKDAATAKSLKELKKFGDNVTALMDLSIGRLDALVVDEVVGRYYTTKKPGEYRVLEENFGTEDYGVGTRKDDTELMAKLQKTLDEMKKRWFRRGDFDQMVRQGHHQEVGPRAGSDVGRRRPSGGWTAMTRKWAVEK
jgi:ABC-type amino acid transport substrate-binding protein